MELTILIPALNEEKTIEIVINKAKKYMNENNISGEVLVINNGSADKTKQIALLNGARVLDLEKRGYGNAIRAGIKESNGKFIIMGDADDSYNFLELDDFINNLKNGYDLVIGNRFNKNMEKGAMPFSHRYIGTPVLSFLVRKKCKIKVKDVNCGLRGFNKEKILELKFAAEGMEFACEMIIKIAKAKLTIKEVEIKYYKDKRNKKSHLNTIRDGIRNMKVIMDKT